MLARDALPNNPQRLLETGEPVAVKAARRVREGAVGKGLMSISTSLAAYFIKKLDQRFHRSRTSLDERTCSPVCFPVGADAETQALWFADAGVNENLL